MKSIKFSFSLISLLCLFIFSCVALVANAQEEATERTPREQLQEGREEAGNVRQNVAERRTELQERVTLTEERQKRIENLAANLSNRMDAVVTRLVQITERLHSRSAKLSETGIDTSVADSYIAEAESAIEEATRILTDIDFAIVRVTSSETPREAWNQTKGIYQSVAELLRTARTALLSAVHALREAASPTPVRSVEDDTTDTSDDTQTPAVAETDSAGTDGSSN